MNHQRVRDYLVKGLISSTALITSFALVSGFTAPKEKYSTTPTESLAIHKPALPETLVVESLNERASIVNEKLVGDYKVFAKLYEVDTKLEQVVTGSTTTSSLPPTILTTEPNLLPNDPYVYKQWALSVIEPSKLWYTNTVNPEILVAVLDTGIDKNHEDLEDRIVAEVNFTTSPTPNDICKHGTHIAGIIAAISNNSKGIAGMAPESHLLNVKVADDGGRCETSVVAQGITWAVNNGASVINVSIQLKEYSKELEDAVNYAWSQGAIVIAAAGNNTTNHVYPAYLENCLAVAATTSEDNLAPLSNYGDWVDVAAPGSEIYSTLPGNKYGYETGTSFAAAHVSGLAALLFDVVTDVNGNGRLNDEVWMAIVNNCHQITVDGVGSGRISAGAEKLEEFLNKPNITTSK